MKRSGLVASLLAFLIVGSSVGVVVLQQSPVPGAAGATTLETGSLAILEGAAVDLKVDRDHDGLADVVENFVYGSDPERFSSTGNNIPDGWFARYGFDPTIPGIEDRPAAQPPAATLPKAYGGAWPTKYQWTLGDAYAAGRPADWTQEANGSWSNAIDPRNWSDENVGIPYGWLLHHGLALDDPSVASAIPATDKFTLRQEYEHDTDPNRSDTDGDDLPDSDEILRHSTDPRNPSTSGSGIPDGWLVRFGFDPTDPTIGTQDPALKGISLLETFEYNVVRFGRDAALGGAGLDPRVQSSVADGIPDGWLVRMGLSLEAGVAENVVDRAASFDQARNLTTAPIGHEPIPDLQLTIANAYEYGRPGSWDEKTQGPWFGGLDPNATDSDQDGLPDAVEIRGWYAARTVGTGPDAMPEYYFASSDPKSNDTDADGLDDLAEYLGETTVGGTTIKWTPSDPRNADTAYSGISDGEKILGSAGEPTTGRTPLDPTRRDSDKDFLPDGDEALYWTKMADAARGQASYRAFFPDSGRAQFQDFKGAGGIEAFAARLEPMGNVDQDKFANLLDDDSDNDGILDGFEVRPELLELSHFPSDQPRAPTDPAHPDTDGDRLTDQWELVHGEFTGGPSGGGHWDLDPTRQDSDHDGQTDDQEDLDAENGDITTWFSYTGDDPGARQQFRHSFSYDNFLEQEEDTDPHVADENRDGLSEGWIYFWTKQYKADLLGGTDLGRVVPTDPQVQDASSTLFAAPISGADAKLTRDYRRFVDLDADPAGVPDATRGESYLSGWPKPVSVLRSGAVHEDVLMGIIVGTHQHTLADDARLGLNPYLADTDGDGLDDAWEALLGTCAGVPVGGADPRVPDSRFDADGDGASNAAEYRSSGPGPSPCRADTDLGGVSDPVEQGVGFNPLNPGDDLNSDGDVDTDHDGLVDAEEILGGTNPLLADSDLDGLLDGGHRTLVPDTAHARAAIQDLQDLGIMHQVSGAGDAATYEFFGEEDFSASSPTDPDVGQDGVPDGWQAAHFGNVLTKPPKLLDAYRCGRPAWWDESALGVWWWGVSPHDLPPGGCPNDLDQDGLNDRTGEDPVPAASHFNLAGHKMPDALATASSRKDSLRLAQTWGECAGDPETCKAGWTTYARAPVRFHAPLQVETLTKGTSQDIAGRLVLDCPSAPCPGVGNRAVVLHIDDPDDPRMAIGAAITDPNGNFVIRACVCTENTFDITTDGIPVLGRDAGTVRWNPAAREIDPLPTHTLHLKAYASTGTFFHDPATDPTHPQYAQIELGDLVYHATARATTMDPTVIVTSPTTLQLDVESSVPWSERSNPFIVSATLVDDSGRPVPHADVIFSLGAESRTRRTDATGANSTEFVLPATARQATVSARFAGTARYFLHPPVDQTLTLQVPSSLTATVPGTIFSGEPLHVSASLRSLGLPIANQPVDATFGVLALRAMTDENGNVEFVLPTLGLELGAATARLSFASSLQYVGSESVAPVDILAKAALSFAAPSLVRPLETVKISGRLTLPSGAGLGDATLKAFIADIPLGTARTEPDGAFTSEFEIPISTRPGQTHIVLQFEGTSQLAGVTTSQPVRVVVPTTLTGTASSVAPGQSMQVLARLVDVRGHPIQGAPILFPGDDDSAPTFTGPDGTLRIAHMVPANASIGPYKLQLHYPGSQNQTYSAATGHVKISVTLGTILTVDPFDEIQSRNAVLRGTLLTTRGEPVAKGNVTIFLDQTLLHQEQIGNDGTFQIPLQIPPSAPAGRLVLTVSYAGNQTLGASETGLIVNSIVPTLVKASLPSEAGRGTNASLRIALFEDNGRPIAKAPLQILLGNARIEVETGTDGQADAEFQIPADMPLGQAAWTVTFAGSETYLPTQNQSAVVIRSGAKIRFLDMPSHMQVGQPVPVAVSVHDEAGNPLAGQKIGLRFADHHVAIVAETNETGIATASLSSFAAGETSIVAVFEGSEALARTMQKSPLVQVAAPVPHVPKSSAYLVAGLAAVGLLALAGLLWYRFHPSRNVMDIFKEASSRIEAGGPWAAAVLLAYSRLGHYLRSHGFIERASETARDFMTALNKAVPLPASQAVDLVRLFERARYAKERLGPDAAREARDTLRTIVRTLEEAIGSRKPQEVEL